MKIYQNDFEGYGRYRIDVLITILVLTMPFWNFGHLLFNSDYSNTISIFGLGFEHTFETNEVFVWYLAKELIAIGLFSIWFFTSGQKWKYCLILLISFSIFNVLFICNLGSIICYVVTVIICGSIYLIDFLIFKILRKRKISASVKDLLYSKDFKSDYKRFNSEINLLESKPEERNEHNDNFNKFFYLKTILGNLLSRKVTNTYSLDRISKLNWVFGFTLLICFALLFFHHLIPETLDEINLGFIIIDNHGFQNVSLFIWFQMRKLVMIITLTVWFVSCDEWWKYAILSPLTLYTFQFWEAFQDEKHLDAAGNLAVAPIIFLVISIVILLSKTIKYRIKLMEIYDYLVNELDKIFIRLNDDSTLVKESLSKYEKVKAEINTSKTTNEHLKKLYQLRHELLTKLEDNI